MATGVQATAFPIHKARPFELVMFLWYMQVYNVSGLLHLRQQLAALDDDYANAASWLSYQLSPRATIFWRDTASVVDLASMRHLMRSKDYTHDKVWHHLPIQPWKCLSKCSRSAYLILRGSWKPWQA